MREVESEEFAEAMNRTAEAIVALDEGPAIPSEGLLYELDEWRYHADPCETPSLSASVATTITHRSLLHAWHEHPRLGGARRKQTEALTTGRVIHALLLESLSQDDLVRMAIGQPFEIVRFDNFRTKEAREVKARKAEAGILALTAKEYAEHVAKVSAYTAAAEAIGAQLTSYGVDLAVGKTEVSAFWHESTNRVERVRCRGRFDHVLLEPHGAIVTDLKSIRSADPRRCERHIEAYGYDIQRAAYVSALSTLRPELAGRVEYRWFFFEAEPPYAVTPGEATGELAELGELRWRRAVERWADALRTNVWPAYVQPGSRARLNALPWAERPSLWDEEVA